MKIKSLLKSSKLFLTLLVLFSTSVYGNTKSIQIDINGAKMEILAPKYFHEISSLSPETRKLSETMTPPSNKLLAVFLPESDLEKIKKNEFPDFKKYMFLQVLRESEAMNISTQQFQLVINQLKEQQNTLMDEVKDEIKEVLDNATDKISKENNISLNIKVGEQVPLGIFYEKPNAVSMANLTKYKVEADGESNDYLVVSGTTILLINNKMLYAYVFNEYESPESIDWLKSTSTNWTSSLLNSKISSKDTSTKINNTSSGIDWERVVMKGIIGAIVGGLIALLISVLKRKK